MYIYIYAIRSSSSSSSSRVRRVFYVSTQKAYKCKTNADTFKKKKNNTSLFKLNETVSARAHENERIDRI